MAKQCDCHKNRRKAMDEGMTFEEADRKYSKPGYHEHRCECLCGCSRDTQGYALCPSCYFLESCMERRGVIGFGVLGLPITEVADE